MLLWDGSCIVHETFSDKKIIGLKTEYPNALLIAHPECEEVVLNRADFVGSTSALLNFTKESAANEFIVATEEGIIYQMQKASPSKKFIPAPPNANCACNECPYMKLNTMEKLYLCMKDGKPEITLDEEIRKRALKPIQKMLEMS
jgi:quinolinate synthase